MIRELRTATLILIVMTLLAGGVYPLVVTVVAQVAFPKQANGNLIRQGERNQLVGSELIGQPFSRPEYFWGRLSATSPFPYNSASSSGSNFGPSHPDLKKSAEARISALQAGGTLKESIPVDLVTASASGLDPHISLAAAEFQISRVAAARKNSEDLVRELVLQNTEGRLWGMLGEPRVNVLRLNLALDGK